MLSVQNSFSLKVLLVVLALYPVANLQLPAQSKELKRATLDLKKSIGREDPEGFLEAFTAVLATGERRAIKIAVDAYVDLSLIHI